MNTTIDMLNLWGAHGLRFFWSVFWQSSLLILLLFVFESLLKRKLRPAIRYGFWLLLLVKLTLPPSLALPSGLAWWVPLPSAAPAPPRVETRKTFVVRYAADIAAALPKQGPLAERIPSPPRLSLAAWAFVLSSLVSLALLAWMLLRWRQVARYTSCQAVAPEWLKLLFEKAILSVRLSCSVQLRVVDRNMSPAVFGLLRPVVVIPHDLIERLSSTQLRAVLLHELIHLKRGDMFLNCLQTVLQIVYWWHPLLWVAIARIRRIREEAVDDAVMLSLGREAGAYAPTLLEVARITLNRSLITLGLVGILESPRSLRQRIERLMDFRAPKRAGLTVVSALSIVAFGAIALPMGQAPATTSLEPAGVIVSHAWPDARFTVYGKISLEPRFLLADLAVLRSLAPAIIEPSVPMIMNSNELTDLDLKLKMARAEPPAPGEPLSFAKFSGGTFRWQIGGCTNNSVNYLTDGAPDQNVLTGADSKQVVTHPEWSPLEMTVVPWSGDRGTKCQIILRLAAETSVTRQAEITIPAGGAAVWAVSDSANGPKCQIVILREMSTKAEAQTALRSVPETQSKTDEWVQDAKLLYQLGKLSEAEAKLLRVLQEDPRNPSARYILNLIREAQPKEATPITNEPSKIPQPLYTRIFKVEPTTFIENLRKISGFANPTTDTDESQRELLPLIRNFFKSIGVDLESPKTLFYQDRQGHLLVRATLRDLEIIELALQEVGKAPPQVNIKAIFLELPASMAAEFSNTFSPPNQRSNGSLTAVLTEPQSRKQLAEWKSIEGVKILGEPSITTLSGRQSQIQIAEIMRFTSYTNTSGKDSAGSRTLVTNEVSTGPVLDTLPYVSEDGFTVQLTAFASMTEFVGYDNPAPGWFINESDLPETMQPPPADDLSLGFDWFLGQKLLHGTQRPLRADLPSPHFRVRQVPPTTAIIRDGQTLILGGFKSNDTTNWQEHVPVLGDVPVLGRLFQTNLKKTEEKSVIIFITPTIIDPAGNRFHPEK